jgi:hypothetical protein
MRCNCLVYALAKLDLIAAAAIDARMFHEKTQSDNVSLLCIVKNYFIFF